MPWKENSEDGIDVSGALNDWLNLLFAWYEEDLRSNATINRLEYLTKYGYVVSSLAKRKWSAENDGPAKIEGLKKISPNIDDAVVQEGFSVLDFLDYLAE